MGDTLKIFGSEYANVKSFKVKDASGATKTYYRPEGTKTINQNGNGIDVAAYETVDVNVSGGGSPILQSKSVVPTEAEQTVTPDAGYDGLSSVEVEAIQTQTKNATPTESAQTITPDTGKYLKSVAVGAVSSTYVGSGIDRNDASDLTVSGASVTVPAGFYAEDASKAVAIGSAATPATSITANPSISVSSSGLITASVSESESITPTVSPGYVSSGTAGTASVSGSKTQQLETQAAITITPTKSQRTVGAAGKYMLGAVTVNAIPSQYQDVSAVNAAAGDVVSGKKIVAADGTEIIGSLVIQHYYVSTSEPTASDGADGDIWLVTGA